jgi:hypothetical protein
VKQGSRERGKIKKRTNEGSCQKERREMKEERKVKE